MTRPPTKAIEDCIDRLEDAPNWDTVYENACEQWNNLMTYIQELEADKYPRKYLKRKDLVYQEGYGWSWTEESLQRVLDSTEPK